MNGLHKLGAFLIILVPLAAGVVLPVGANPAELTQNQEVLRLADELGDKARELTALNAILEITPWRGDLWLRAGRLYFGDGQANKAVEAFTQANSLGEIQIDDQFSLAKALITSGDSAKAFVLLRTIQSEDAGILIQVARLQAQMNDTGGILQTLDKAFSLNPQNTEVNYMLGVHLLTEQPESAIYHLEIAGDDGKYQAYSRYLRSVVEQYGDVFGSGEWYFHTGQALGQVGEWTEARNAFYRAVELLPASGTAWAMLGEAQQQTGEDGKASLDKAQQIDPGGEIVNGLLALYYRRQGNIQLAMEMLEKAAAANPGAPVWQIEAANTVALLGDLDKAVEHFNLAVVIDREDYSTWQAYARFCITHNYKVDTLGLTAARQALLLQPNDPVLIDLLGTAYLVVGDLDSAERLFLQALELDNEEAAILIHLGQVYLMRADTDTALDYLRRAAASATDERLRSMANTLIAKNGGQ